MEAPPFPRLTALALACCSFRFTHKLSTPKSDSVCRLHVAYLPRGLESCRYGGTVGVTFSELGPDSNGDRSSMPSEAMSSTVTSDGQRRRGGSWLHRVVSQLGGAAGGGCWCRVAPGPAAPVTAAWKRWSSAVIPAPHWHDPGRALNPRTTKYCTYCDGICAKNISRN